MRWCRSARWPSGLLALVLLVLLRTDLVASWRKATPPDAPNRFVINVMPEQSDAFQKALRDAGVKRFDWYPMIRGRLVAVNGKTVTPDDYIEDRAKRLVDREFNLSSTPVQPPHNQVVAGRWQPEERGAVSVEEGIATTLGLKLGDELRFDIGGHADRGEDHVAAQGGLGLDARQLLRDLSGEPARRRARHLHERVPRARAPAASTTQLVRAFPNITNVDMTSTINQVQGVLDKVIRAVEFLFGFTLAAGVVVLFAAVTATREERAREFAIMRAVGAQRRAAAPGAARRAGRRRPAGGLPGQRGRQRRGLGHGALCLRFRLDRLALGAAVRRAGRRGAGAGGGLVGPARSAEPAGGGDPAPRA